MSKLYYGTLVAKASGQLQNVIPLMARANNKFMVERSLDLAIQELQETQKILILAKESYSSSLNSPNSSNSNARTDALLS